MCYFIVKSLVWFVIEIELFHVIVIESVLLNIFPYVVST